MFEVKIILDSVAPCGKRLTTITCTSPRIVLAEINTHRDRARNAASSRAIPFPKMLEAIESDPFIPIRFGSEKKGMQTGEEIDNPEEAKDIWMRARNDAIYHAKNLADLGVHKSICNRLVEPWMWCTQVMTATEWSNFFRLRCHADAEIHFQKIATMIRDAMSESTPELPPEITEVVTNLDENEEVTSRWHLPFVAGNDFAELLEDFSLEEIRRISVARCARVSYLTHEGKRDPDLDLKLFDRLVQGSGFGHWSAHEHVAQASSELVRSGPFIGWNQYRKAFPLENQPG